MSIQSGVIANNQDEIDLNGKFEALNTHVKKLDTQVAQTAGSVMRQEGTLPGRTDANPKYQCSAVTLRSGRKLTPVLEKDLNVENLVDMEEIEAEFEDTEPVSIDRKP